MYQLILIAINLPSVFLFNVPKETNYQRANVTWQIVAAAKYDLLFIPFWENEALASSLVQFLEIEENQEIRKLLHEISYSDLIYYETTNNGGRRLSLDSYCFDSSCKIFQRSKIA